MLYVAIITLRLMPLPSILIIHVSEELLQLCISSCLLILGSFEAIIIPR